MSILIATSLSAAMVASHQEPVEKKEYKDREELKAKILDVLKKRKQEKELIKQPEKEPKQEKVQKPDKEPKQPEKAPKTEKEQKPEPVLEEGALLSPEYLLKPAAFLMYLDKYEVKDEVVNIKINSRHEMFEFTTTILKELPHTVNITSDYYKPKQLKELYDESMSLKVEELTPTMHGLVNYSVDTKLEKLVIKDNSNENYNAATIKKAVDMYVKDVVPLLKGDTEVETIQNIYDFMFNNFKYNANSYKEMLVGNLGYGELACNGFSYLADQLFEEAGIESYIRAGYSHYWNVLTLEDGSEVTFDVTTDIVLNEYQATLGASTKQHVEKASTIGFYSAEYYNGKYHDVHEYSGLKGTIK